MSTPLTAPCGASTRTAPQHRSPHRSPHPHPSAVSSSAHSPATPTHVPAKAGDAAHQALEAERIFTRRDLTKLTALGVAFLLPVRPPLAVRPPVPHMHSRCTPHAQGTRLVDSLAMGYRHEYKALRHVPRLASRLLETVPVGSGDGTLRCCSAHGVRSTSDVARTCDPNAK
jgi:hypothetical protein